MRATGLKNILASNSLLVYEKSESTKNIYSVKQNYDRIFIENTFEINKLSIKTLSKNGCLFVIGLVSERRNFRPFYRNLVKVIFDI